MITNGSTVKVHYTGTLVSGEKFDSSIDRNSPFEFMVGSGQVISGFEGGLMGKMVGDKVTIHIKAEDGYGQSDPNLMVQLPKSNLPGAVEVGTVLEGQDVTGNTVMVTVKEVHEDFVVIDGNHPLAGQDLIFDIEILEVA